MNNTKQQEDDTEDDDSSGGGGGGDDIGYSRTSTSFLRFVRKAAKQNAVEAPEASTGTRTPWTWGAVRADRRKDS